MQRRLLRRQTARPRASLIYAYCTVRQCTCLRDAPSSSLASPPLHTHTEILLRASYVPRCLTAWVRAKSACAIDRSPLDGMWCSIECKPSFDGAAVVPPRRHPEAKSKSRSQARRRRRRANCSTLTSTASTNQKSDGSRLGGQRDVKIERPNRSVRRGRGDVRTVARLPTKLPLFVKKKSGFNYPLAK